MPPRSLDAVIEAILFASEEALSAERIAGALERQDATPSAVAEAVARLNDEYRRTDRTFEIVEVAGGYKLLTLPEYNSYIRRVLRSRSREKLSQAALETLAVIAYRQPVTRADIENIRGVEVGPVLRMLVDRGLVRIVGREEALGHPLLYGTTKLFLEVFGLRDLESLPRIEELTRAGEELMGDQPEAGEGAAPAAASDDAAGESSPGASEAVSQAIAAMAAEDDEGQGGDAASARADDSGPPASPPEQVIRLANHQPGTPPQGDPPPQAPPDRPADESEPPAPPETDA